MNHAHCQQGTPKALHEISDALFTLRDGFIELSQLLKDIQFELDLEGRRKAEIAFYDLLEKMRPNLGAADLGEPPSR